jgi:hypothetical protein
MRKTVISAAALAMSTALAGFAYAAAPGGPTATDPTSVVIPASTTAGASVMTGAPDDSAGRMVVRHGADDPVGHDVGDDRSGARGHGIDDRAGHDAGDDHGSGGHGADDPAGHGAGDDHGSGGHGSDD